MSSSEVAFNNNSISSELEPIFLSVVEENNISVIASNTEGASSDSLEQQSEYLPLTEQEIVRNSYQQQDVDEYLFPTFTENEITDINSNNQDNDYLTGNNYSTFTALSDEFEFYSESSLSYIKNRESSFDEEAIVVGGENTQQITASLSILGGDSDYRNETGLFLVDDETGKIGDLSPADAGYAAIPISLTQDAIAKPRSFTAYMFDPGVNSLP